MGCYSFRESNEFIIHNDNQLQQSHSSVIKINNSITKQNGKNIFSAPLDSSISNLDNRLQKINEFHTDTTLNESNKDKKEENADYPKELKTDIIDKNTEKSFQNLDENFLFPNIPYKTSHIYNDPNNNFSDVRYNNTILSYNNLQNLQDISSSNIFSSKLEKWENITNQYCTEETNGKNVLTCSVIYDKIPEEYKYEFIIINKFVTLKWKKHKKHLSKFI